MSRLRLQLSSLARGTQTVDLFHLSYGYNEGDRAHARPGQTQGYKRKALSSYTQPRIWWGMGQRTIRERLEAKIRRKALGMSVKRGRTQKVQVGGGVERM